MVFGFSSSCASSLYIDWNILSECPAATYQGKLLIELHLLSQHGNIVKEVWLHVTPHVGEPPEFLPVLQQHVIPFIFLICTWGTVGRRNMDCLLISQHRP